MASLIASGEKWVENRRWPTGYRGPLAIHAGKGTQYLDRGQLRAYPTGCVVAVAELVACVHLHAIEDRDPLACDQLHLVGIAPIRLLEHVHTEGPWCWVLRDVRKLPEPVYCRGAQGFWEWTGPELTDD